MLIERDDTVCGVCKKNRISEGFQNWVQCDKCKIWHHFDCVGVSSTIAQLEWTCSACKAPASDQASTSKDFAMAVRNACATMEACKLNSHLDNPLLFRELVDKLPTQQKLNWAMHPRSDGIPVIKSFSDWIYKLAEAASTVIPVPSSRTSTVNTHAQVRHGLDNNENSQPEEDQQQQATSFLICIMCKSAKHHAAQCE
ncbi:uncharacterized protein LOC121404954 [Drosophila obscura]|uniref:uncharacterized protein LOC121404954 n=1 Tax=Drosophila obscura TaxID=7282 RepID=UPI001BB1D271|nr:uncharacterized protein LOC121404954 [Drosophila obscura]